MNGNSKHWITGVSLTTTIVAVFYAGILWQRVNTHSTDIDKLVASVSALTGVVGDVKRKQDERTSRFEEIYRRLDRLEVNPRGNPR